MTSLADLSRLLKESDEDEAQLQQRRPAELSFMWRSLLIVLYVVSGVLQPILIEVLTYNGACEQTTMLFILPNYLGMGWTILFNQNARRQGVIPWPKVFLLAAADIISNLLCFTGLVKAGSAIFTVVYSSVTAYTALFSYFFFGKQLHIMQWGGVLLVVIGLTCSSMGSSGSTDDGGQVTIGIIMIIIGSMFHSMVYILSESILARSKNPIAPEALGSLLGVLGAIFYGGWQLVYTIPNFQTLVVDQIAVHHGTSRVIITAYVALVVMNLVHFVCFFNLISALGSTTTGIMKGIQSVLVFVISHYAFCSLQKSQCFSPAKGLSLIVVVCGVFTYSMFSSHGHESKRKDDYIEINGTVVHKAVRGTLYQSRNHEGSQFVFQVVEPGLEDLDEL